jgi:hypothetical protein
VPDLKISATTRYLDPVDHTWKEKPSNPKTDPKSDPIVKLTKMDDYTILCLFDCLLEEIYAITLAQPPHQQRYALGDALTLQDGKVIPELQLRVLYTSTPDPDYWPIIALDQSVDQSTFYHDDSRRIDPAAIGDSLKSVLLSSPTFNGVTYNDVYTDKITNSCLLGLELNDPCCECGPPSISEAWPCLFLLTHPIDSLVINSAPLTRTTDFPSWTRQLWTGADSKLAPYQPQAKLSAENLPTPPAVKLTRPKLPVISLPPRATPRTPLPPLPATPRLHSSRVIPVTTQAPRPMPKATPANHPIPKAITPSTKATPSAYSTPPVESPPSAKAELPMKPTIPTPRRVGAEVIAGPQFTLAVHPGYRPPAPTPFQSTAGVNIYAPMDFCKRALFGLVIDANTTANSTDRNTKPIRCRPRDSSQAAQCESRISAERPQRRNAGL